MYTLILAGGENRKVFFNPENIFPRTACDMLFIFDKIIIVENAYKGQDAIIPVFHGNPQPLIRVYWNKIKDLMEERIHLKTRAMRDLLRDIDVYYLPEQEV